MIPVGFAANQQVYKEVFRLKTIAGAYQAYRGDVQGGGKPYPTASAQLTRCKSHGRTHGTERNMANWDLMRDFGAHLPIKAVDGETDIANGDLRRKESAHLAIKASDGERDIADGDFRRYNSAHLAIKAVDGVHAARLVVASGQVHVVRVQPLEGEQREDHFC